MNEEMELYKLLESRGEGKCWILLKKDWFLLELKENSYFMSHQEIIISIMPHPKAGSIEGQWKKNGWEWARILGTLQVPLPDPWHSYLKNFLLQSYSSQWSSPPLFVPLVFLHPCKLFGPNIKKSSNINKWAKKHLFYLVLNTSCHLIWSPVDILLDGEHKLSVHILSIILAFYHTVVQLFFFPAWRVFVH